MNLDETALAKQKGKCKWKGRFVRKGTLERKNCGLKIGCSNKNRVAVNEAKFEVAGTALQERLERKRLCTDENDEEVAKKRKAKTKVRESSSFHFGIRQVDLDHLIGSMWCKDCKKPLLVQNICEESRVGLASKFSVLCKECSSINYVATSKKYQLPNLETSHYEINTKDVFAAIHAGFGCSQLNKFLSIIGSPPMYQNLFKKHERIIGPIIEFVAKESCNEVTMMERLLTAENIEELTKLM